MLQDWQLLTLGDKVYIGGPMSNIPYNNFAEFDACGDYLDHLGIPYFSPANKDRERGWVPKPDGDVTGFDRAAAMKVDLDVIVNWATAIVLLPGWEKSRGASSERIVAEETGKKVLLYHPDAPDGSRLEVAPPSQWAFVPVEQELGEGGEPVALIPSSSDEVRTVSVTGGAKGVKDARFDLIPPYAEWVEAEIYGWGAKKYDERNWENGYEWGKSIAALERHIKRFKAGENIDPESGKPHMGHARWHTGVLLEFERSYPEYDDRTKLRGGTSPQGVVTPARRVGDDPVTSLDQGESMPNSTQQ